MTVAPGAPLLRATDLECVRGGRRLFSGLSFEVPRGGLLQVRGGNGSGKTSLLRIVCGLLHPDAGSILWNGRPAPDLGDEFRGEILYVGHLNSVKDELDPAENLGFAARIAGLSAGSDAIDEALEAFGLGGVRQPCRLLSQGQKRRASLARLKLGGGRTLWVLDEPFSALDVAGVDMTRALIEKHHAGGGAVIFTTHQEAGFDGRAVQCIEF